MIHIIHHISLLWALSLTAVTFAIRHSVAAHPLDGSVDQPPVRVLQAARESGRQSSATGRQPEEPAAAEGSGPTSSCGVDDVTV